MGEESTKLRPNLRQTNNKYVVDFNIPMQVTMATWCKNNNTTYSRKFMRDPIFAVFAVD